MAGVVVAAEDLQMLGDGAQRGLESVDDTVELGVHGLVSGLS